MSTEFIKHNPTEIGIFQALEKKYQQDKQKFLGLLDSLPKELVVTINDTFLLALVDTTDISQFADNFTAIDEKLANHGASYDDKSTVYQRFSDIVLSCEQLNLHQNAYTQQGLEQKVHVSIYVFNEAFYEATVRRYQSREDREKKYVKNKVTFQNLSKNILFYENFGISEFISKIDQTLTFAADDEKIEIYKYFNHCCKFLYKAYLAKSEPEKENYSIYRETALQYLMLLSDKFENSNTLHIPIHIPNHSVKNHPQQWVRAQPSDIARYKNFCLNIKSNIHLISSQSFDDKDKYFQQQLIQFITKIDQVLLLADEKEKTLLCGYFIELINDKNIEKFQKNFIEIQKKIQEKKPSVSTTEKFLNQEKKILSILENKLENKKISEQNKKEILNFIKQVREKFLSTATNETEKAKIYGLFCDYCYWLEKNLNAETLKHKNNMLIKYELLCKEIGYTHKTSLSHTPETVQLSTHFLTSSPPNTNSNTNEEDRHSLHLIENTFEEYEKQKIKLNSLLKKHNLTDNNEIKTAINFMDSKIKKEKNTKKSEKIFEQYIHYIMKINSVLKSENANDLKTTGQSLINYTTKTFAQHSKLKIFLGGALCAIGIAGVALGLTFLSTITFGLPVLLMPLIVSMVGATVSGVGSMMFFKNITAKVPVSYGCLLKLNTWAINHSLGSTQKV